MSSPPVIWWGPCFSSFYLCVLSYYVSLRFEFRFVMSVTISAWILCSVRLYLQLFLGGRMSYLCYLCLFSHSGVQHILCFVFALFFIVLCTLYCQFLWIVLFWLPLRIRYSLTFNKYRHTNVTHPYNSAYNIYDIYVLLLSLGRHLS